MGLLEAPVQPPMANRGASGHTRELIGCHAWLARNLHFLTPAVQFRDTQEAIDHKRNDRQTT